MGGRLTLVKLVQVTNSCNVCCFATSSIYYRNCFQARLMKLVSNSIFGFKTEGFLAGLTLKTVNKLPLEL